MSSILAIPPHSTTPLAALEQALARLPQTNPGHVLRSLIDAGHDRLPLPGAGATIARWRALAAVGAHDLALAKLFEGHTDALAIVAEAGVRIDADNAVWATWCAEPPDGRVQAIGPADGSIVLRGRKAWCSGAPDATRAVVSCWGDDGAALLAAVDLRHPGVTVTGDGWHAVGMQASRSVDVLFADVPATLLGGPGFYVQRAGFWHGGAGVAACWYGAATRLAEVMRARLAGRADPHRLAQLGRIGVALGASAALLRETAAAIDAAPQANAMALALAVRLDVEASASLVLELTGRALGAGPLCKDAALARLVADLPVFMRQSHAERDQEALGRAMLDDPERGAPWTL